jgi:hypothetical protein
MEGDLWGYLRIIPSKPGVVNGLMGIFGDSGKSSPIPSNTLEVNKTSWCQEPAEVHACTLSFILWKIRVI